MKITSFNPIILSSKAGEVAALFEALGFEKRHAKTGIHEGTVSSVSMKDAGGFRVDVTQVDGLPQDMTTIRMNVDDLEEAIAFFTARGFTSGSGDRITDTGSSKATMLVAPSGFTISVVEHIKK